MTRLKALKFAQVLLAVYIGILTYADMGPPGGLRDTETGLIMDQELPDRTARGLILVNGTELGATQFQVICIGITRMSAFFMYPGKQLPKQRYHRRYRHQLLMSMNSFFSPSKLWSLFSFQSLEPR
jgi:hypothetical protein